jgi:hypothetical protein
LTLTLRREAAHVVQLTFLPENEGLGPEFIYGRRSLPSKYDLKILKILKLLTLMILTLKKDFTDMLMIFLILSAAVISFFLMICLTIFRIEKTVKISLMIAERAILKSYGKK